MEKLDLPVHNHPLFPSARFSLEKCKGCGVLGYFYGGYRCNEPECDAVFHKECAESLPKINHPSHPDHPDHPLKLDLTIKGSCSSCRYSSPDVVLYCCSICDFKLDLKCARELPPAFIHSKVHQHPLKRSHGNEYPYIVPCPACKKQCFAGTFTYGCSICRSGIVFHPRCIKLFPEIEHASHPKHPLKYIRRGPLSSATGNEKCILCGEKLRRKIHHCDVCNFTICTLCAENPPPLDVLWFKTHEHQLHLVPRHIIFICNACGTQGDRSPYFCLECNFMIHRACIDLPRIININRHDHRISYTGYLGQGDWICRVCRQEVDGVYGAYTCSKCPTLAVHSRCAIRHDVWDKIELEGVPEDTEEIAPFKVIDDNTIKHFSHVHNLKYNKEGMSLDETRLCEACVFQICYDSLYSCEQCEFILHESCANLPQKRRHMCHNQRFTLDAHSLREVSICDLCNRRFMGFKYKSGSCVLDVRCGSISEPFVHKSHSHPLYYYYTMDTTKKRNPYASRWDKNKLSCDECAFTLDFSCALLPEKVMMKRYDDHPLFLSYGDNSSADGDQYWCDVCEMKLDPKKWFYTCNPCGVTLHVTCIVGDFSYQIDTRLFA